MSATSPTSPQTLNLYAYCTNDPVNYADPSGLGFFSWLKGVAKRVLHALIHAVIQAVITLIITGNPSAAFAVGVADFLKQLGWPSRDFLSFVPQWNPNAGPILGNPGAVNRYVIVNLTNNAQNRNAQVFFSYFDGGGDSDVYDVVLRITVNCKNNWPEPDGPNCPGGPLYKRVWHGTKVVAGYYWKYVLADGWQANVSVLWVFNANVTVSKDLHFFYGVETPNVSEIVRTGFVSSRLGKLGKPIGGWTECSETLEAKHHSLGSGQLFLRPCV